MHPKLGRGWSAVLILALCAGVSSAATFSYSISCQGQTIGPDQIQAYSQSGSVTLTPNVANVSNTVDFFNGTTNVFFNNLSQTLNGTLLCNFTLGGVTVTANRGFSLVVQANLVSGNTPASSSKPLGLISGSETHTFTFQPFSFNVVIPSQGTVTVSQGTHTDSTTITRFTGTAGSATAPATILNVDPASSSLLFVPLAVPTPLSPTIYLTLTGLAAAGWYETRRRKMAALRG
jgi:hypothetical protein